MFKNATTRTVAIYSGISTLIVGLFVAFIVSELSKHYINFPQLVITVVLTVFAGFYFTYFYTKLYVIRKIKVIYKNISRQKLNPIEGKKKLEDELYSVENDVQDWAKSQQSEIARMQEMELYRKSYVGNVSHELKTPIFNMQGYLHTLQDGGIDDPSINQKYLDKAIHNLDRLEEIVSELDLISKLESGKVPLVLQTFDIKELCEKVFDDHEMQALKKSIILDFKSGADQRYIVKADKDKIRTVLNNLVSNSIKYGQKTGYVKIAFYDMETNILIEVSDSGTGIGDEHLDHVFDRFYRVDSSRSRDNGGSGLGLSIVKHIVEAHMQTIHVRSAEGIGSTFGFTLEKS